MKNLETFWQEIFREKFPDVVVRLDPSITADDGAPFYYVFMLPDDKHVEFLYYSIDELWKIADEHRIEPPHLFVRDVSTTAKSYPEIYEECRKKNVRRRSAPVRRAAKPRGASVQSLPAKPVAARKT